MPNWPVDNGSDFDDDGITEEDFNIPRRRSVLNVPERRSSKTWNGEPVSRMASDHIMNSILFCERKFAQALTNFTVCYEANEEFYFKSVRDMYPEYAHLREEWDRRNATR